MRLAFVTGMWMVVIFRPQQSTLSPKSDLFTCILGSKADRSGMVTSPNLAAPQNAVVRQAQTATSRLLVFKRCWIICSMYSMVTGSCFCCSDSLGAIFCAPLIIAPNSGPSTTHAILWMMCQAQIAATYPQMVDAL